jgi:hypothetical protein
MSANNIVGTALIRENTLLPAGFVLETEDVSPGWRAVRNLNGYELDRTIQKAHWNFFYLAGEVRTIAFGRENQRTVSRAVRQVLAKLKKKNFNSLEITGFIAKRFLGIPFVSLSAHSRHLQESLYLVPLEVRTLRTKAATAPGTKVDGSEAQLREELLAKANAAVV